MSMDGEKILLLRKGGGKPSPAHIVYKSSAYASFMPDLALILIWDRSKTIHGSSISISPYKTLCISQHSGRK